MWALADRAGLDVNSPYAYVLWGDHFASTSVVALDGSGTGTAGGNGHATTGTGLLGYVTGFRLPEEPTTLFVWQVAVDETARGRGLASTMLDELLARTGATTLEATVTPDNHASAALFRAVATRNGSTTTEELAYPAELFPGDHEAEVRFRIPVAPP